MTISNLYYSKTETRNGYNMIITQRLSDYPELIYQIKKLAQDGFNNSLAKISLVVNNTGDIFCSEKVEILHVQAILFLNLMINSIKSKRQDFNEDFKIFVTSYLGGSLALPKWYAIHRDIYAQAETNVINKIWDTRYRIPLMDFLELSAYNDPPGKAQQKPVNLQNDVLALEQKIAGLQIEAEQLEAKRQELINLNKELDAQRDAKILEIKTESTRGIQAETERLITEREKARAESDNAEKAIYNLELRMRAFENERQAFQSEGEAERNKLAVDENARKLLFSQGVSEISRGISERNKQLDGALTEISQSISGLLNEVQQNNSMVMNDLNEWDHNFHKVQYDALARFYVDLQQILNGQEQNAVQADSAFTKLLQTVRNKSRHFLRTLGALGIEAFTPEIGGKLDEAYHEINHHDNGGDIITAVISCGFRYKDKLIAKALVEVNRIEPETNEESKP